MALELRFFIPEVKFQQGILLNVCTDNFIIPFSDTITAMIDVWLGSDEYLKEQTCLFLRNEGSLTINVTIHP